MNRHYCMCCLLATALAVLTVAAHATEQVATVQIPHEFGVAERDIMGTVIPERRLELAFEIDGRIITAQREMGSTVDAGSVVLALDDRVARARVALARAGVARAAANLLLEQAQHDRLAVNHARQLVSDADMDVAYAALQRAHADHAAALAENEVAALVLEKHRLVTTFDAVLDDRTPTVGSFVRAGVSVGSITDPDRRLQLQVSSSELRALQAGGRDIRLRGGGWLTLISASPIADATSGMHQLQLRMPGDIEGAPGELVALQLINPDVFAHLNHALREDEGGAHILLVNAGIAQRVQWPPVEASLLAGRSVIVLGSTQLADGVPVTVVPLDEVTP